MAKFIKKKIILTYITKNKKWGLGYPKSYKRHFLSERWAHRFHLLPFMILSLYWVMKFNFTK